MVFAKEQPAWNQVQVMAGASTTLSCEVAKAQTPVIWYKDSKKLSGSSKVRMEAMGCTRRLVLQQAGKVDGGEYSCEAGGQRVSFCLDISGQFFGGTILALCVGSNYSQIQPGALSIGPHLSSTSHFIPMAGPEEAGWAECEQKGEVFLCNLSGASHSFVYISQHQPRAFWVLLGVWDSGSAFHLESGVDQTSLTCVM